MKKATAGLVLSRWASGIVIRVLRSINFPNSPAWLFSLVTDLLGFVPRQQEHKTQWLGLEGEASNKAVFLSMLRKRGDTLPRLDRSFFTQALAGRIPFAEKFYRSVDLDKDAARWSEDQRRALAASVQQACTEIVGDMAESFGKALEVDAFCFGGGLFHNSVIVSALEDRFGKQKIFVPPVPGNAGTALGSARYLWHQEMGNPRSQQIAHTYWGPSFSHQAVKDILDNCKVAYHHALTEERKIEAAIEFLKRGKIVGWFQGRSEFGPRALGNRSLLASPWAPYVRENLNDFVKHREWFQPFAISVTQEACPAFFDCSSLCAFMSTIARVKPGVDILPSEFLLPDRRIRLHVVERGANPLFWRLLGRWGETAPAPLLINTSFNLFGEPLVSSARDAVRSYCCCGIDAMVIDNFVLSKASVPGLFSKARVALPVSLSQS